MGLPANKMNFAPYSPATITKFSAASGSNTAACLSPTGLLFPPAVTLP